MGFKAHSFYFIFGDYSHVKNKKSHQIFSKAETIYVFIGFIGRCLDKCLLYVR